MLLYIETSNNVKNYFINTTININVLQDPPVVIDFDNYEPVVRGRDADAFIKWMSSDLVPADQPDGCGEYMVGYLWPSTKVIFPDFLRNETQDWWKNEIAIMHEVSVNSL